MTRRVLPSAEQMQSLQSVATRAPQAGGPAALPPPPPPPPVVLPPPVLRPQIRPPSFRWTLGPVRLEEVLPALLFWLVVLVIVIGTCVANAHGQTRPTPRRTTGGERGAVIAARPAPVRKSPFEARHLLLPPLLFLGLVVQRKVLRSRRRTPAASAGNDTPASTPRAVGFGAASSVGNTRRENQDRVWVGRIADADIAIVCDGLGGCPNGANAADTAVRLATQRLRRELTQAMTAGVEGVRTLLLSTAWSVATGLSRAALREDPLGDNGWRTTLVLVVALPEVYVVVYVGDGGVFVLREGVPLIALLDPHKAATTPDILDASLGPVTEGRPSFAVTSRLPRDLLVVATDGIADLHGTWDVEAFRACLDECDGDTARAAERLVEAFEEAKDAGGAFVVTDNLTIALLSTPAEGRP